MTTSTPNRSHFESMVQPPLKRKRSNDDQERNSFQGHDSDGDCSRRGGMGPINIGIERLVAQAVDAKRSKLSERDDALRAQNANMIHSMKVLEEVQGSHNARIEQRRSEICQLSEQCKRQYVSKKTMADLQTTMSSLESKFDLKSAE
jgi:hypothetical protein